MSIDWTAVLKSHILHRFRSVIRLAVTAVTVLIIYSVYMYHAMNYDSGRDTSIKPRVFNVH